MADPSMPENTPTAPASALTATNPTTGEKMQFDSSSGQWVPLGLSSAAPAQASMPYAGTMPPGAVPSRIQAQTNAPDPNMVPRSDAEERARRLLLMNTIAGNRAGVTGASDLLKAEETYQARQKQVQAMGADAALLAKKQAAATRVYAAVNDLENKSKAWYEHAPDAFNAANGPYNSTGALQFATGWANKGGYDFYKVMDHDIHKLTALYRDMPSSGASGGGGSNAQDENFMQAMGEARQAASPEAFFAIMNSAKNLVRDKGGLAPDFDIPYAPLAPQDVRAINKYAKTKIGPTSPYVTAERLPPGIPQGARRGQGQYADQWYVPDPSRPGKFRVVTPTSPKDKSAGIGVEFVRDAQPATRSVQ